MTGKSFPNVILVHGLTFHRHGTGYMMGDCLQVDSLALIRR